MGFYPHVTGEDSETERSNDLFFQGHGADAGQAGDLAASGSCALTTMVSQLPFFFFFFEEYVIKCSGGKKEDLNSLFMGLNHM